MPDAWFDELAEFLRIPSISADPAHAADVVRAGEWVCDFIRAAGGECELVDWHGQPLAIGEIRASSGGDARRRSSATATSTCSRRTRSSSGRAPPFEPEIRDDYLYGRGTVDDKGQLYMLLAAARELARAGELPVNVRFCCDGEEETGGHSIVEFLEADERGARRGDHLRQRHDPPRRAGLQRRDARAWRTSTSRCAPASATCTPGIYGGAALNAAHALVRRSSALIAHDGRSPSRCARGSRAPTDEELAGWRELPAGRRRARRAGRAADRPARGRGVLPPHVRRAGARRERDRDRLAAPPEDGAAGRGGRERLDPARARPAGRGDRARRSSGCCARPRPTGADARGRALVVVAARASSRRTRRRSSSASTRSSARSAGGRR